MQLDGILDLLRRARSKASLEVEIKFRSTDVDNTAFRRVVNALSVCSSFAQTREPATLDVTRADSRGGVRVSIVGRHNIDILCSTGSVERLPRESLVAIDKRDAANSVPIQQYGLVATLRDEVPIDDPVAVAVGLTPVKKMLRLKQRISFASPKLAFRVDCTVVYQGFTSHFYIGSLVDPRYEIEMELVDKRRAPEEALADLQKITALVYKNVYNSPFIMPLTERSAVLAQYLGLVSALVPKNTTEVAVKKTPGRYLVGPKPVTLNYTHLLPDNAANMMRGYSVTDKADGDRHLFFIAANGRCYIIDNTLGVRYTGLTAPATLGSTLLDGEYVDRFKVSSGVDLKATTAVWYLAFDAYFFKGENITALPLKAGLPDEGSAGGPSVSYREKLAGASAVMSGPPKDRIAVMEGVASVLTSGSPKGDGFIKFIAKPFFFSTDEGGIFGATRRILDMDRPYHTDGVIFTPSALPVGAAYAGEKPKMTGRWTRTLKWKSESDNTIDFLVEFVAVVQRENAPVRFVHLYTGYAENALLSADGKVHPIAVLINAAGSGAYVPRRFGEALLPMTDGHCTCENGDVVANNSIVEFNFANNEWRPVRVRSDKTRLFNATGSIADTANNYEVAVAIFDTIVRPVTKDMISGLVPVPYTADDAADGAYYKRDTERSSLAIRPMLDFHNSVKKNAVFEKLARMDRASSLLELGCGRGGDLFKALGAGFNTLVGVDISESDLLNPDDGAYRRLFDYRQSQVERAGRGSRADNNAVTSNERVAFARWDVGLPIAPEHDTARQNAELQQINDVLFGFAKETAIPRNLGPYYGLANIPFDVVSTQFAIHYLFRSAETLDAFCSNVASRLRKGGVFVCTYMDGSVVDQLLTRSGVDTVSRVKHGKVIWALTKKYHAFDKEEPAKNYGKPLDVFVESINQTVTEFLVDSELMRVVMEKHGLVPMPDAACKALGVAGPTLEFRDLFASLEAAVKSGKERNVKARGTVEEMTSEEKTFSFLNRVSFFVKA